MTDPTGSDPTGSDPTGTAETDRPARPITVRDLQGRKGGTPIVCLTAYTAPMARLLDPHVEFLPVCPEVEIGLGVPRDPIRLVEGETPGEADREGEAGPGLRVIQPSTGRDLTDAMTAFAHAWADARPTSVPSVTGAERAALLGTLALLPLPDCEAVAWPPAPFSVAPLPGPAGPASDG